MVSRMGEQTVRGDGERVKASAVSSTVRFEVLVNKSERVFSHAGGNALRDGNVGQNVTLVQKEISQQILDMFPSRVFHSWSPEAEFGDLVTVGLVPP